MPAREVVLTDAESETWLADFRVSADDNLKLKGAVDWSISKRTLRGGPSANIDVVTIDNGNLSIEVLPTRGMGLWQGSFRGKRLGWHSPVRFPVHPDLVNLADQRGTGWLTGFNEWMCRCGLNSIGPASSPFAENRGSQDPHATLHGRIANLPAHFVAATVDADEQGRLAVRGVVEEAALFGGCLRLESLVHTAAGSHILEINDTITNCSDVPAEVQILYHTNFGPPLLGEGSRVFAAIEELAPYDEHSGKSSQEWDLCRGPTPGFVQQCYFVRPIVDAQGVATILLCKPTRDFAVQITYDSRQLPCLTLWKNFAGENDGYVVGIEPGTSYPNSKTLERQLGRVPVLEPGDALRTSIQLSFFDDPKTIAARIDSIAKEQAVMTPQIHKNLQSAFSFKS